VTGGIILSIGFGFLPVDLAEYGVASWHGNLLGGAMFILWL
jgi:hypothetical protein